MQLEDNNGICPKFLFIIPIEESGRLAGQKKLLQLALSSTVIPLLEKQHQCKAQLLFIEQKPDTFNMGAITNAGYYYLRSSYPEADLASVTLIFHDVDKIPFDAPDLVSLYQPATEGKVDVLFASTIVPKELSVGNVFSITASDFHKCNGYPNLWGWVPLELEMFRRCKEKNIVIDYTRCAEHRFGHIMTPNTGLIKSANAFELYRFAQQVNINEEGLSSLSITKWTEDVSQETLLIEEFRTLVEDSPQHKTTINLHTPVSVILNQAYQWYRSAYFSSSAAPAASTDTTYKKPVFTYATPEGIQNIRKFVKEFPRSRMQQLQK